MTRPVAAVTGGTGFLGRHVAAALDAAGWRVRLLVRPEPWRPMPDGGGPDGYEIVPGDLGDAAALARLVDGAAAVVHLAGLVKARDAATFLAVNGDGSARLAAAVAGAAPKARLVQVSSQAAREPGLSGYAASKRAGEDAVTALLPAARRVIVRPCVVYGPWDREGLALLRLARRRLVPVPAAPEPVIAMLHASDAAAAIVACCADAPPGRLYEICDGRLAGHPWREIVRAAAPAGRQPRFVVLPDLALLGAGLAADVWARATGRAGVFGLGKAREILHRDWRPDATLRLPDDSWRPRIGLAEGLAGTVAWWGCQNSRTDGMETIFSRDIGLRATALGSAPCPSSPGSSSA